MELRALSATSINAHAHLHCTLYRAEQGLDQCHTTAGLFSGADCKYVRVNQGYDCIRSFAMSQLALLQSSPKFQVSSKEVLAD